MREVGSNGGMGMSGGLADDALTKAWDLWRYLVIGVFVVGCATTAQLVHRAWNLPGFYWGQANVVFITPPNALAPNTLGVVSGSLISTAGIIQREVMDGPPKNRVVSESVTLLDEGVMDGVSVDLPNAGGQWENNFERPVLRVQSVNPDKQVAQRRLEQMVAQIQIAIERRQDEAGVLELNRITTQVTPSTITVGLREGDRKRAAASTALLGLLATGSVAVLADAVGHRRRRADQRSGATAGPDRVLQPTP